MSKGSLLCRSCRGSSFLTPPPSPPLPPSQPLSHTTLTLTNPTRHHHTNRDKDTCPLLFPAAVLLEALSSFSSAPPCLPSSPLPRPPPPPSGSTTVVSLHEPLSPPRLRCSTTLVLQDGWPPNEAERRRGEEEGFLDGVDGRAA